MESELNPNFFISDSELIHSEEYYFFHMLRQETSTAYKQSKIKIKDLKWASCITPIFKHAPIIAGINWGLDKRKPEDFQNQVEYHFHRKKIPNWNFINALYPLLEKYFNLTKDSEWNYTNVCFFRSKEEDDLKDVDWNLSIPLFKRFAEYVDPPYILLFGKSGYKQLDRVHDKLHICWLKSKIQIV